MTDNPITIREARPEDAARILKIYAPFVENTTVTFELTVPTVEEFAGRIERTLQRNYSAQRILPLRRESPLS